LIFEDGFIIPPTGPGLGIELDQDVVKSHLVTYKTLGHRLFSYSKLK